jgi:hypothetical protein
MLKMLPSGMSHLKEIRGDDISDGARVVEGGELFVEHLSVHLLEKLEQAADCKKGADRSASRRSTYDKVSANVQFVGLPEFKQ